MAGRKRDDRTRQGEGMNVEETRQASGRERMPRQEREETRQAGGRDRNPRQDNVQPQRDADEDRTMRSDQSRGRNAQRSSVERGREGLRGGSSALEFEDQDVDLSDRGGIQRTGRRPSEQHDRTQDRTIDRNRM